MIDLFKQLDIDVLLFINGLHNSFLDILMYWMTKLWFWLPFFALILAFIIKKYKKKTFVILLLCAVSVTLTDQTSVAIKNHVKRFRPSHKEGLSEQLHLHQYPNGKVYRGGNYGFVSSHAANSFGIAVLLIFFFVAITKHAWWIFPLWASLFCLTRMYLGVHYPSDIVGVALLGIAIIASLLAVYQFVLIRWGKRKIIHKKKVTSTNLFLSDYIHVLRHKKSNRKLPNFFTVYADFQTKGRGQQQNTWESEKGKNISMSTLLYPNVAPANQFIVTQWVSLAIHDFLTKEIKLNSVYIKWPNDIYVNDKKIAGILIENIITTTNISYSIAGIGLNMNQSSFSSWIPNPTSVKIESQKNYSILQSIRLILKYIEKRMQEDKDLIHSEYLSHLYKKNTFGKFLIVSFQEEINMKIVDVSPDGRLHAVNEQGEILSFYYHEIKYILE